MKDIYRVELFKEERFKRKRCSSCGRTFWTLDPERETCGDTPCDEYTFIGNPPIKRSYTLPQMERAFLGFFEERGHEVIPRYPVVARWREDIFLTIASIANFQPWVTSGLVPPPANPLVVSQPSIRLKDIDNVGCSGKHFTLFFMGGHHAFNPRGKRVYWTDETVAYCHEFLTKELGIAPEEITYVQDFWEGGGNAGEDFEVNVRGLELATLVFMRYSGSGGKYAPLPLKIVDTGYGLERLVWASQGTPSSYEAVFGPTVGELRRLAGIEKPPEEVAEVHAKLAGVMDIETGRDLLTLRKRVAERTGASVEELNRLFSPLEKIYAIADHLRCLAFMFGDGITPSNVGEGYLARLVVRRTLRLMRELGLGAPLAELIELELKHLKKHFPEFEERSSYVLEVVALEEERYRGTLKRGKKLVERVVKGLGKRPLPFEELVELYDSHGLPPELVKEVADKLGVEIKIPEDFYIRVAKLHGQAEVRPAEVPSLAPRLKGLKPTRALYYEDPYLQEFKARVVESFNHHVVLNQTAFYPEGGGQPCDLGELVSSRGRAEVLNVQGADGIILHEVKPNPFRKGDEVRGKVNWSRRIALMRHHTATHILLGAARRVLGAHVWQHGVQKAVDRTRLDLTHFKRVSREELREIERLANQVVMENRGVKTVWMDRNEAERKYGFELYQGGVVPGRKVRVVEIEGWNTQACAGTHLLRTGEVGFIKVLRTERIQDGVERLEFAAGESALGFVHEQEAQLASAAEVLRAPVERVAQAVQQLFEQWKSARKRVEELQRRLARLRFQELRTKIKQVGRWRVVCEVVDASAPEELIKIGGILVQEDPSVVVILGLKGKTGSVVCMAGEEAVRAGVNCGRIAAEVARALGGGGGGKPELGQGGGPRPDRMESALKAGLEFLERC